MPNYEVDYTYDMEEYGTNALYAADTESADDETRKYIQDTYPHVKNIQIDAVREVVKAA